MSKSAVIERNVTGEKWLWFIRSEQPKRFLINEYSDRDKCCFLHLVILAQFLHHFVCFDTSCIAPQLPTLSDQGVDNKRSFDSSWWQWKCVFCLTAVMRCKPCLRSDQCGVLCWLAVALSTMSSLTSAASLFPHVPLWGQTGSLICEHTSTLT